MLRPPPTAIGLTMADVDLARRRLAPRHDPAGSTAPLPRVRRGAQRSYDDALRRYRISSSGESAILEGNIQQAEFSPPRHRKDLGKLGGPYGNEPILTQEWYNGHTMAMDGIHETIVAGAPGDTGTERRHGLCQTPYAASPLRQTYVLSSSSTGSHQDNRLPPDQAGARAFGNTLTRATALEEPSTRTGMRFRSPQDLFVSAADSLDQMYMTHQTQQLRPPITRLSSLSSPNLTSRTVSSGIIHSRHASATISSSVDMPATATAMSGYAGSRVVSRGGGPPAFEMMRHCTSPLEELEGRLEALSQQTSPSSTPSFYTANSQSHRQSQIRFPSFESPPRHGPGPTTESLRHSPQIRPRRDSVTNDITFARNIPVAIGAVYSPQPHKSSGPPRGFPVFSPDLPGADDYSRYPDPRLLLNRRTMPVGPSPSSALDASDLSPERAPTTRSVPSRAAFMDRLPHPPPGPVPVSARPPPTRQSNRENDGSAEEEMMAREFAQMQLRGGADGQRRSDENAPTRPGAAAMMDDTPPREGRLERLIRG